MLDLAAAPPGIERLRGSVSTGRFGVPVASGFDCDGDGRIDHAMSAMRAGPLGRPDAGQVFLVFGDGRITGTFDSGVPNPAILSVLGGTAQENAGIEVWMDDVTGDGLGDLIVGRSNYSVQNRMGAGALSIVVGTPALRELAARGEALDLAAPPSGVSVVTLQGADARDRLGFWMRTGDATGDGISDVLVSADQANLPGANNAGSAFLLRGGAHLNASATIDLATFGTSPFAAHLARFEPPTGAGDYHFGATLALLDLDQNGRAEVLISAALSRIGGLLAAAGAPPESGIAAGGNAGGSLFIFWDNNLPPTGQGWPPGLTLRFETAPGDVSRIDGGTIPDLLTSDRFGEELIGGVDYDGDGRTDLFVGDIRGDTPTRIDAGLGHVFFDSAVLRRRSFGLDAIPPDVRVTHLLGPSAEAISSDTTLQGDIDGDGRVDLVVASPLADPEGRRDAGTIHVLWGQSGPWPEVIDFATRPAGTFKTTDIYGARGATSEQDFGDVLMYSAVGADVDADGRTDLVVNEMTGNGAANGALDVGNLVIISGRFVPKP